MTSLKKQTVSGVKWLVGSSFLQKTIQLVSTVVLARILGPSQFGLFALAFIAIDALGLFKSMGFDSALIQRKDNVEKAANTAFFIIPLLGIVLYLILAISAPYIGRFLNNQQVVPIIRALGLIFVISCFGKVPAALLEKHMRFARVTVIEVSTAIVYSVTAIVFALLKFGVWSLVIAYVLKTVNQNVLTFIFSGWRPRLEFDKKIALEMFHFGKFIFLGCLVWFLKMNLDNLLVGKLLGIAALGIYAIAFNIANFTADYLGAKISRITFPAYSKVQDDMNALRIATLKIFKYISIISVPVGVSLFFLSSEFLNFFYGQKWLQASDVLKILAWAGIFNALSSGIITVFYACGKSKLGFWITTVQVVIFIGFIAPIAKLFGILGVSVVVTSSSLIAFLMSLYWLKKILSISFVQIYENIKPGLVSSLLMSIGIIIVKSIGRNQQIILPYFFNYLALFFYVFVVYIFSLFKIEKTTFNEIKRLLFSGLQT